MKLYAGEIDAFALGAALGWLVTYFVLTRDKRIVGEIKSKLELLAGYHDLTKEQYRRTMPPLVGGAALPLASDETILGIYRSVVRIQADKLSGQSLRRLSPTMLAAEIIICRELLGLTPVHAVRVLLRSKNLNEIKQNLQDVTDELSAQQISN